MYLQLVLVASHTSPQHKPQNNFDIKVDRFEPFTLPTSHRLTLETPAFKSLNPNPKMLCVQNSETWTLSKPIQKPNQFNPQTAPKNGTCFSQKKNGACFSQKRGMFFPKTEPAFPKNGACFSQKRISPKSAKSVAHSPKVGGSFS